MVTTPLFLQTYGELIQLESNLKILAHRGLHHDCIENSYEAFEKAVSIGVDGIETDVRRSADGIAILYHDRTLPDNAEISSLTYEQICSKAGFEVPTLEAALERWPDIIWNIEIKSLDAVDIVRTIIKKEKTNHLKIVTSFWHNLINNFVATQNVLKGLLVAHHPQSEELFLQSLQQASDTKIIVWSYEIITHSLLESAAKAGFINYLYDINTVAELEKIKSMSVDTIITDNSDLLLVARDS